MNLADANNVSPLLDEFSLGSPYSSHNGIICCPAIHAVTKEKFILKQISIPESQTQVNAMLLTGACADKAAAQRYYADMTQGLVEEIHLLERLAQTRGFAAFFSHQTTPKEGDETGMDLWVLSPYRTTLTAYAKRNAMTHLNAVNLGIDLCAALTLCRKAGYLYQNLKPENIFVTPQRQFQVGDFGFLPLDHLTYATFPAKYRSPFAAPELFDDFGEMNGTIDLYALGMVLYLIYNGGQGPFAESQDGAEARRLKGDPLPPPAYADYEMAAIILKATAFHPADRWQSPEAMGQALVSYMQRNSVNDSVIAAPIVTTPTLDAEADALDAQAEPEAQPDGSTEPEPAPDSPAQSETPESQSVSGPETSPVQEEDAPEDEEADGGLLQEEDPEPHTAMEDSELADILSRAETFLAPAPEEDSTPAPASPAQEDPAPVSPQTPKAEEEAPEEPGRRRSFKGLIVFLSVLLVLAVLTVGAYYYYIHYYCLPIEQHLKQLPGPPHHRRGPQPPAGLLPGYLWQHLWGSPDRRRRHLHRLKSQYAVYTDRHCGGLPQANRRHPNHLHHRRRDQNPQLHRRHRAGRWLCHPELHLRWAKAGILDPHIPGRGRGVPDPLLLRPKRHRPGPDRRQDLYLPAHCR